MSVLLLRGSALNRQALGLGAMLIPPHVAISRMRGASGPVTVPVSSSQSKIRGLSCAVLGGSPLKVVSIYL